MQGAFFRLTLGVITNIRLGCKGFSGMIVNIVAYLTSDMYYKNITIVNDASRVVNERHHNLERYLRNVINDSS
jgi:hypothetical protein